MFRCNFAGSFCVLTYLQADLLLKEQRLQEKKNGADIGNAYDLLTTKETKTYFEAIYDPCITWLNSRSSVWRKEEDQNVVPFMALNALPI